MDLVNISVSSLVLSESLGYNESAVGRQWSGKYCPMESREEQNITATRKT